MRTPNRPLLVLHADPSFRERIQHASQSAFELDWISDWNSLPDAVRDAAPSGLIVVDPYYGRALGEGPAPDLHTVLRAFPSSTIVAAPLAHPQRFQDLRMLGDWGVSDVIDTAEDTAETMRLRLDSASGRPLRALLERTVRLNISGRGRAIINTAVEIVAAGGHARDLSRALGISDATLLRWCRRAGIPVPRRLLMWMRLLLAAQLLDDPGQTVLGVALACGYSSDRTLRRACYSALGMGPSDLRDRGAFKVASAAFMRALAATGRSGEHAA